MLLNLLHSIQAQLFSVQGKLLLTPPTKHTVKPKSATTMELKARTRGVYEKKLSWKCKERVLFLTGIDTQK